MVIEHELGGEFQLGFSLLVLYSLSVSAMLNLNCNCAGAMDSDLDAVLASGEGAQKSKRPRGSRRSDRPSKVLKRTEKTPPAPTTASTAEDPTAQVNAFISTASFALPPVKVHPVLGPPPKKPSTSKSHMLSIRPHVDEFAIDNAAGAHRAILSSDILSRVGQSLGGFDAEHLEFVNKARDCITLYDKSIELTAAVTFHNLLLIVYVP